MKVKNEMFWEYWKWRSGLALDERSLAVYVNRWADGLEKAVEASPDIPAIDAIRMNAGRTAIEADTNGTIRLRTQAEAVRILSKYWVYGDVLRKWFNEHYGVPNAEKVVDPTVICMTREVF